MGNGCTIKGVSYLITKFSFQKFQAHTQFWETWKEFEVKHGNEDTVREMLRIKRSVQVWEFLFRENKEIRFVLPNLRNYLLYRCFFQFFKNEIRNLQATYNANVNFMSAQMIAAGGVQVNYIYNE